MTNFRYSQNPRMARKRPSRTSRIAPRRRATRLGGSRRSNFDDIRELLEPIPYDELDNRRYRYEEEERRNLAEIRELLSPNPWVNHQPRRANRRRPHYARHRANRRPARPANYRARRKIAQEYNGWFNWDTWATYGSITSDYGDYQRGIRATLSGNPLDLIAVFENSVYREPDVDVSKVDWDEVYFALEEEN